MVDSRSDPPDAGDPVVGLVRAFARSTGLSLDDDLPLAEVWRALVEAGDPAPGLSFAVWAAPAAIGGPLAPLLSNSPDLGALLDQLCRFHPLFGRDRMSLNVGRSEAELELRSPDGAPAHPDTVDACFALICRVLDTLTAAHRAPSRVRLRRNRSAQDFRYRELFGNLQFGADADRCSFTGHTLATPIVGADPMVLRLVQPYAERQLAEQGQGWSARVGRALAERLDATPHPDHPLPSLADIARSLAVSSRSLQQYLRAESTSYSVLLDTLQRDRALAMLAADDQLLTTTARRAGFSTSAAFARAVRRWTGSSPSAYRDRHRHSD
jgi:AraC-like DNA-binding protein